jgi:hypothetical protein
MSHRVITRQGGACVPVWRRVVLLALSVAMAACAAPALAPEIATERWQYRGEQRLPELVQLEGTLTIGRGDATRFEGTLDLQRTDAQGRVQRQSGLVRGRRTELSIDFEVALDGGVMRHVGRTQSMGHAGTWVDEGGLGGALVSGAFTLVRVP